MKNGEHLYEKLGEVNEKYVDEAEKYAGGSVKDKKRNKLYMSQGSRFSGYKCAG